MNNNLQLNNSTIEGQHLPKNLINNMKNVISIWKIELEIIILSMWYFAIFCYILI